MPHHSTLGLETPLLPSRPYYFGQQVQTEFAERIKCHEFDRCYLVTSRKLLHLFGQELLDSLVQAGVPCEPVLIKETERHKNWRTLRHLCETLVARGATKDSILLALGGGVVGNIVGLAAALLFRGVRFIDIPTTFMAQTDSALSNKQAINGRLGKNHFGVYHAPLFIWADVAYVESEPARQQRSGIVEGIKNVFISQDNLSAAEEMLTAWEEGDRLYELVRLLIDSKLSILRNDPTERHSGVTLEYGHTFGHAIEWLAQGKLYHGEAVAIGMCLAAEMSYALGYMSGAFLHDHYRFLGERLGVPTELPADISLEALYQTMLADNKRTRKGLSILILSRCGEFVNSEGGYHVPVDRDQMIQILNSPVGRRIGSCDQTATLGGPNHNGLISSGASAGRR
jgi:3-dehydroquinate synthetase